MTGYLSRMGEMSLMGTVTITDSPPIHPPFISTSHLKCEPLTVILHNDDGDTKKVSFENSSTNSKLTEHTELLKKMMTQTMLVGISNMFNH